MIALTIASLPPGLNPHLTKSRLNDAPHLREMLCERGNKCPAKGGTSGIVVGVWWINKKLRLGLAKAMSVGRSRKKSSRNTSRSLLGGAAISCVVLGCGWTVYTNILSASVYPTISGAGYNEPVVKQGRNEPARDVAQAINEAFAALPAPPITPNMFNERFAASEPTSVPSRAAEVAASTEALKVALAQKPVDAPKIAEAA